MTPEYQRILLVDDDDVTNFLSREIFRHYHPDVCIDIAQNGKEAIELLLRASEEGEASLPQIILLDINMPVMDGWDFLDHFKVMAESRPNLGEIRVFILTSSVYPEDIKRAMTYPLVQKAYSKPLNDRQIEEMMG
ncbi:Response regulator receiver domain-containing protein [Hydrobacter penzbergensis]|jgi:CheY-like chemotaxis protein|uniref:Response regulator receiver domain-containing protein n=1 Tax=Hydrobacter penzbergensis TaxID=1235997 RepID=A0A8X8ICJ4_9BACT|nr:response regulator [Hydrobacter penzbergensis]SDW20297.1 Response regulator receiver domain-containing protein [Hydrobacter penzbergensis]